MKPHVISHLISLTRTVRTALVLALASVSTVLPLPAQSLKIIVPTVLPRDHHLGAYSPEISFIYSGLSAGNHTLKVWLLDTSNFFCASTQWCERKFTIHNLEGAAGAGQIVLAEPMDVFDYPHFLWVARLYDSSGMEVTSAEQPAEASAEEPPVLHRIGRKSGTVGREIRFTLSAAAPDKGKLQFSAGNLPPGAGLNANTGEFIWVPAAPSAYTNIVFSVTTPASKLSDAEVVEFAVKPDSASQR